MPNIHPTALISPDARISSNVEIGPYVIIGKDVRIGAGCRIEGHAQVMNSVEIGEGCLLGHGAVIGGDPQDKGFSPTTLSHVVIGSGNVFREHVTVHRSIYEGGVTRIGNGNFLMVGSHVGHDAVLGNDNTLANNCLLGGHVELGDRNFLGGGAAFHQFIRVGELCMVKGLSAVSQDVPPFIIVSGSNQVRGLNSIGMRRAGYDSSTIRNIRIGFGVMYLEGLARCAALEKADSMDLFPEARLFIDFFRNPSRKGICMP